MYDYLHCFLTAEDRDAAYPRPEGAQDIWTMGGITVMQITVWLANPEADDEDDEGRPIRGREASPRFWMGLASNERITLDGIYVEMQRPSVPTPWRDCVISATVPLTAQIVSVDPMFAGCACLFD